MKLPLTPPSRRDFLTSSAAVGALTVGAPLLAQAAGSPNAGPGQPLKKYNVKIRRFNPQQGSASGDDFILPVDSPDEEHAVSATLSNAVAFTTKVRSGQPLPIAFTCLAVTARE